VVQNFIKLYLCRFGSVTHIKNYWHNYWIKYIPFKNFKLIAEACFINTWATEGFWSSYFTTVHN